ncbi:MAG: TonB-dependent receptor plug domain-containing protein [Bacteroidia bacterium]
MKTAVIVIFLLITAKAHAQTTIVEGKVTDGKESLPGVTVYTDEKNATGTDADGNYNLELPQGKATIHARSLGYAEVIKEVVLSGATFRYDIVMTPLSTQLSSVVVSAGKFEQKLEEVTVSMNTIKPGAIEQFSDNSIESAITNVTGINVNDGQANIRGGSGFSYGAGSRVLVLVDDMPMLSADANDVKWSFLPIENMEQIEIIKGASSALYGSSAMNGVINFRTGYAKSEPVTHITQYTGIYDSPARREIKWWGKNTQMMTGANMFHARKIGNWDIVIGGHYLLDEGFREGETEKRARANLNIRYRFKKVEGLSAGVNLNYMETFGGLFIIWNDDTTGLIFQAEA